MKPMYYPERIRLLKFLRGRILDIGCNYTDFHNYICKQGGGEVYGFDIEVSNYNENMIKGDACLIAFKSDSFDSIFAGEVLEHLTNPAIFLLEVQRILKKGGIAVITIPNQYSLTMLYLIEFIKKREVNYYQPPDFGHVYSWDISLITSLVERVTNLNIVEFGYTEKEGEISFGEIGKILHKMFPDFFSGLIYIVVKKI